ncbi:MAG: KH domain-containing protein [Clostridia bacterium]|nr:KH domain-containing protein [Clostridia bacterium]
MIIEAIATGKTLVEAQEAAVAGLGDIGEANVEFEILAQPKAKTLGIFGGADAKVRAYVEVPDAPKKEAKKQEVKTEAEPVKEPVKSAVMSCEQEKKVINYLTSILENMGVNDIKIEIETKEDGTRINFDGDKLGVVIGRKGETLDAIQHLVSLVANKGTADYVRITLNPGGYRQKREEILVGIATKSAAKAIKFNKNVILEAMNSYERRIIHNAVQEIEGVMSWSIGENEHRRVVIGTSKDNKPFRENNNRRNGGKGRYNRKPRPSQSISSEQTRAPKSDGDLPLYGKL